MQGVVIVCCDGFDIFIDWLVAHVDIFCFTSLSISFSCFYGLTVCGGAWSAAQPRGEADAHERHPQSRLTGLKQMNGLSLLVCVRLAAEKIQQPVIKYAERR